MPHTRESGGGVENGRRHRTLGRPGVPPVHDDRAVGSVTMNGIDRNPYFGAAAGRIPLLDFVRHGGVVRLSETEVLSMQARLAKIKIVFSQSNEHRETE